MNTADSALNPDIDRPSSRERPLSNAEQMQRNKALCAANGKPDSLSCTGNLFVGMFFDGTGNNRTVDYETRKPSERRHSNVVRMYHAYPDEKDAKKITTNKYYSYYIPGVGTKFEEIGDLGNDGLIDGTLGGGTAWRGDARIVWGLIQVINAIHFFAQGRIFIENHEAKTIVNELTALDPRATNGKRRTEFKARIATLKKAIKGRKPEIERINLSVFGFSRGAAEARAFVNWLYELCEHEGGVWSFAGIPLRLQFLGLFDTVASVGLTGMFSFLEGHQSWAKDTMQIHPAVEQCLHFVAAHEVRACFPSDSVRKDGSYPANAKEYVYPGVHSDIGGGYEPQEQGKIIGLARIPGYDMYHAARIAGVPFKSEKELKEDIREELVPHPDDIDHFKAYCRMAAIAPGALEDMTRQHMSWYFSYRWQLGYEGYLRRSFFDRAKNDKKNITHFLESTQMALLAVLAGLGDAINARIKSPAFLSDQPLMQPYCVTLPMILPVALGTYVWEYKKRTNALSGLNPAATARKAANIIGNVARWRTWLDDANQAEVHDSSAVERETLNLVDVLKTEKIPVEMTHFFDSYVHDSMAGFACVNRVPEFEANGFGIAKFRRIYFGNKGDKITRDAVDKQNERRIAGAKKKRSDRAQWDAESTEFARTRM